MINCLIKILLEKANTNKKILIISIVIYVGFLSLKKEKLFLTSKPNNVRDY